MAASGSPRRLIREVLETAFPESVFSAFCIDFFYATAGQFSGGMSRSRRITLLFEYHTPLAIAQALRQAHPEVELPDDAELAEEPAPATPQRASRRRVSREKPLARLSTKRPTMPPQAAPHSHPEKLFANLLRVERFGPTLYCAPTELSSRRDIAHKLMERLTRVPNDWVLHEKRLWSFRDLSQPPWSLACEAGGVETFDPTEWSNSDNPDVQRLFVQLMGRTLQEMLGPVVGFHREQRCYFFRPRRQNDALVVPMHWTSEGGARKSRRTVAKQCPADSRYPERRVYQHMAFEGRLMLISEQWYLAVHPTHIYTTDGKNLYFRHAAMLSGLKRMQRNSHVFYEFRMWAEYLKSHSKDSLFKRHPIVLGDAVEVSCPVGIDDDQWLKREPPAAKDQLLLPGLDYLGEQHDVAP